MRVAVEVFTVGILLLSVLLVVFPDIIYDVRNDGGNIVVIGDEGGIICRTAVKDFLGDAREGVLI